MMRRVFFSACCAAFLLGLHDARGDDSHQVHLVQQVEVDGEIVETTDLTPYTGDGFTTSSATARTGYIFTHWSTSVIQEFANRDPWGRAYEQVSFSLYEGMTNTAHYVKEDLDEDGDGMPDGLEIYWYGDLDETPTSDTDGDGIGFARELEQGTNPHFSDVFVCGRGVVCVSVKPLFVKLIKRSEPEGSLFATTTNDVAPGVSVTTDAYSPNTSSFACWSLSGADVATRDAFGRAYDALSFTMPTNDVELVAVCRDDEAARQSLYWYGNETTELTSDTDGDGFTFAEEIRVGTSPLFADRFSRGVICVSVKPQFFKLIKRSDPSGMLFATTTNDVAPGVFVSTDAYSPNMSSFAYWSLSGAADVATRDVFGRAYDALSFTMPTNDVELVAVCRDDEAARQSLYWYGNETTELSSDTDGDGFTFAEEIRVGTSPLFADRFSRGILYALSEELETDLQPFEQMRGAIVDGEYVELFTSGLAGNAATSETFGENVCPLAADVDGDGLFDLVVVSRGEMRLYLNKGSAANPDFVPTTTGDAWANFRRLLRDMERPLVCTANGVYYVSDGGGPIYAFTLADGSLVETGLTGIPGVLDGRLFALTAAGTLAADGRTLTLDTPVIDGVSVSTADIDSDGRTDLLVSDAVGHIWLYRNVTATTTADGAASFKLLHKVWAGTGVGFAENMTISLIDWDDDGDEDVLVGTTDGKLMLLRDPRTGRPTNVQAYPGADNVLLTWDPNSQPRIRGYNVYRSPDAESFARIANQTPLPRYRDVPGVLRDYWYRVTGVSRFYIAGNSTPTVHESMPTDAVYVQFRPSVWLNDTSGFTGSNVTVVVSMNNSMGISADGLSMTFAYDAAVLEPRGVRTTGLTDEVDGAVEAGEGTVRFTSRGGAIATGAGQFLLLDFKIKEVHDVTETTVTLNAATIQSLDGRAVALDLPKSATIEISDSDPIVPAIVAVSVSDAAVESETEFELPVTVTTSETLTNFTATLTWDETLLELKGIQTGLTGSTGLANNLVNPVNPVGNSCVVQTSGDGFSLAFYAKDPASAATNFAARVGMSEIAAVDCHGFAVSADDAAGTVLIKNAHPWVAAHVSVATEDQKVETLEKVTVPFKVTSDESLASGSFTVEWDAEVLDLEGVGGNTYTVQNNGGDFSLTFLARDQHDVTRTEVRLVSASVTDAHGFVVAPSVPVVATVLVHDAHPLVPADVAIRAGDAQTKTLQSFSIPVTVTSSKTLTNLSVSVGYDAAVLDFRGCVGATWSDGVVTAEGTVPQSFTLTFYAKDQHTVTETAITLSDGAATCTDALAANVMCADGTVRLTDANPPVAPTFALSVLDVRAESGQPFVVNVGTESVGDLAETTVTVEWDAAKMSFVGTQEAATVETVSANSRRLTFASSGTDNRYHLNFTAAKIAGLRESAQVSVTAAAATGANGLAGVLQTELPVAATVLIVREVGKYDPGDVDGDGRYTDMDLKILSGYVIYLDSQIFGQRVADAIAADYQRQNGVGNVKLKGAAAKSADVNCDGVVDGNDIEMLRIYIAAAKEAE